MNVVYCIGGARLHRDPRDFLSYSVLSLYFNLLTSKSMS